jgi:alpha-beta hydrolase superfamily lysophospholipase
MFEEDKELAGKGFWVQTFDLGRDYDGAVTAVLVRRPLHKARRAAVLYLHGFVDYFFQDHMADFFEAGHATPSGPRGLDFFALDLRKYGRGLPSDYPYPNFCKDVAEYFPEITKALALIKQEGYEWVLLAGHSTGALIAVRYLQEVSTRGAVDALFLNSPFLEFNHQQNSKTAITLAKWLGGAVPHGHAGGGVSRWYARSLHNACADCHGQWTFNLRLKPLDGFPTYFGWVRAIANAHQAARKGGVECPVLVLHSARSLKPDEKAWRNEYKTADLVLDVEHMKRIAPLLGSAVTVGEIDGGMHDLVLSEAPVRANVFRKLSQWLDSLPVSPFRTDTWSPPGNSSGPEPKPHPR